MHLVYNVKWFGKHFHYLGLLSEFYTAGMFTQLTMM